MAFTMTIDKTSVTMSSENTSETVTITNTFAAEEDTVTTVTSAFDSSSEETVESETASGSVQTGDETPVACMLILLFAALGVLLAAIGMRVRLRR